MKLDLKNPGDDHWQEVLPCDGSARLKSSFFSQTESDRFCSAICEEVPWSSHDLVLFGKRMTEPRLSSWIGDAGVAYTYSGVRRSPEPWTVTLAHLRIECERATGAKFNSVLANLYRSGQDSMPHGSLLVMSGTTQTHWKHRIARTKRSVSPRVNLTYRLVLPARNDA
ncbi:MAG: alpha-ketoglutarate-dependent dioxygenase AlkB [Actinobacteria bacterium]|nr:alpha-ketoglutarate-dependent dioxygenase AlkB [Actinomycetota bacterium]